MAPTTARPPLMCAATGRAMTVWQHHTPRYARYELPPVYGVRVLSRSSQEPQEPSRTIQDQAKRAFIPSKLGSGINQIPR